MKGRNPIVVVALVGLAIIAAVGIYTIIKLESEPKVRYATYGYYCQESRVGELQLASVGYRTYKFEGEFSINTTVGEVGLNFDAEVDFRDSMPQSSSFGRSYKNSSLPFPTSVDAEIFIDLTMEMMLLLPPAHWGGIDMGYSEQFIPTTPLDGITEVTVEMTVIGKEDVVVPSGTYENCFMVNGTQPDMNLELTFWVTEQGVVSRAEITMAARGVDPLTLTMKLEHYE
jgi:hypothetical protein